MRKALMLTLVGVAVLLLPLLFLDFHAAYVTDNVSATQSTGKANGQIAPVGSVLLVYLSGDRALAPSLQREVAEAIHAKELPFHEIRFVTQVPTDAKENPFLAIHVANEGGLWTPVVANRRFTAVVQYAQGRTINREAVLHPVADPDTRFFGDSVCVGACAEGVRSAHLSVYAVGLISLPHMRAEAAVRAAQEAVTLVAESLPDSMNPAKWFDRAGELARKEFATDSGGVWSSFQRIAGCRGGIVSVGKVGAGTGMEDWSLMYYDADQDAITQTLTRRELQAKWPDAQLIGTPSFMENNEGLSLHLYGLDRAITYPPGQCSLQGPP